VCSVYVVAGCSFFTSVRNTFRRMDELVGWECGWVRSVLLDTWTRGCLHCLLDDWVDVRASGCR
jgi:hypothetical protein